MHTLMVGTTQGPPREGPVARTTVSAVLGWKEEVVLVTWSVWVWGNQWAVGKRTSESFLA